MVSGLVIGKGVVRGVRTLGVEIAKSVVLTNGTFGLIHIGEKQFGEVEQEKVQRTELPKI
jgi:tRNA U34 5-carboxymethylaminomethyl modifying enzyme MnmG/GidA